MRIEAYTQVQQLYRSQKAGKVQKPGNAVKSDEIQISSFGKEIHVAKAALANSPEIREELTAPLKAKIENGTYEVSNEKFANKLMKKFEEMR